MFTVFVSSLPFELSPVMVNWRYTGTGPNENLKKKTRTDKLHILVQTLLLEL